jgi:DNA polymerase elongation subunit (family B)
VLTSIFPNLKGDIVTFIGSTFINYGENSPYLNHCIVRNTCDKLPNIKNSVIESYNSEKKVLLAWTNLIQREDPDIIIGYNIFGFDYKFLHIRAKEMGITRQFLKLSRNKNELCMKKDWKTGKYDIETSSLSIASGVHDLKYVKMNGRIQIDLYNYLRRDYNLTQYKLDYVAGYFIGDDVKKFEHNTTTNTTKIYTQNLTGLENGSFVSFEEYGHSIDSYKQGKKFLVSDINNTESTFNINSIENLNLNNKVKWGLSKDDITPKDIFEMTNKGPTERSVIAKYCLQDCNLVHYILNKIDVITGFIEMSKLCSVPIEFIVLRGQGIKLTSYIAKICRIKQTLIPVLDIEQSDEGYEGAIVLDPKCDLYLNDPVICLDYSSLYPSAMISENISQDSKVWTKEYDLNDNLINETGIRDANNNYIYDNLEPYTYVNIEYDLFKWQRKNNNPKAAKEKVKSGYKICRYAQYPDNKHGILPSILEECLAARKATRALIKTEKDPFMRNILDKRQLSIKITANSIYGQTGARTSTFYDKDVAASTTATGRLLLTYAKGVIEKGYQNRIVKTKNHGEVITNAEYVYGDTDSIFFKFNLTDLNHNPIIKKDALEISIEIAPQAGQLASKFLKHPHDLEYEKTFLPFCLLSKKRYVGVLYENDYNKGYRKSMGIVLKRRDNAPIVKDIYGGIIDILMKQQCIETAVLFLKSSLDQLVEGTTNINKLIITKSLRGHYKNPKQIAHNVLAERIGFRDPGGKPSQGDRIPYAYVKNPDKKALQGDKIESPTFIIENNLQIDYSHYITNQIMKPLQQLFGLVLEKMNDFKMKKGFTLRTWKNQLKDLKEKYPDETIFKKKKDILINKEVKSLLFENYINSCK